VRVGSDVRRNKRGAVDWGAAVFTAQATPIGPGGEGELIGPRDPDHYLFDAGQQAGRTLKRDRDPVIDLRWTSLFHANFRAPVVCGSSSVSSWPALVADGGLTAF
jgi:hypothetical protein